MNALVTIPIDLYRSMETKCRKDGLEYKLLEYKLPMSGLIDKERQQLILRCDVDPALSLCAWVEKFFHGAACRIRVLPISEAAFSTVGNCRFSDISCGLLHCKMDQL